MEKEYEKPELKIYKTEMTPYMSITSLPGGDGETDEYLAPGKDADLFEE